MVSMTGTSFPPPRPGGSSAGLVAGHQASDTGARTVGCSNRGVLIFSPKTKGGTLEVSNTQKYHNTDDSIFSGR